MKKDTFDFSKFGFLLHTIIGGLACLLTSTILYVVLQGGVAFLAALDSLGLLVFDESIYALQLLLFGLVFLPSGFIGGLYTGHKVKENLYIILVLPGLISFILFIFLFNVDLIGGIMIQLSGNILGSYLGGYTMNWPPKKDVEENRKKLMVSS
ncbi:MAG: hypothetical protein QXX08_00140 [Candidatus Bathyarchaeia archaeon]